MHMKCFQIDQRGCQPSSPSLHREKTNAQGKAARGILRQAADGAGAPALLTLLCGILLAAHPARAQFPVTYTFTSDFNSAVPANLTMTGNAVVNSGYLKLTSAIGGQIGTAFVDGLSGAQGVQSFRANFKAAIFGGTGTPADGY